MDLETNDPTPTPEPAVATTPATPEIIDPATQADPLEVDAVEVQGGKYVPIGAVHEAREKLRQLKEESRQHKEKADLYDQTAQYVHSVRPYIDFLQANPDLMTRTQQQTAPSPVTTTQPVDEQAEELARTLDLYTADGQPDIKRAQKIRTMVTTTAEAEAEKRVKPLHDSTIRERATHNYQRALVTKAPDGRVPNRQVLDALWARTDPAITATEEGASALVATALGLSILHGGAQAPPQPVTTPAVVTEAAGSKTPNRPSMTALDEKIAGMRGRTADEWGKLTRTFNPGRPSVLED